MMNYDIVAVQFFLVCILVGTFIASLLPGPLPLLNRLKYATISVALAFYMVEKWTTFFPQ